MMAKTLTDNYFFVISGKNLSGKNLLFYVMFSFLGEASYLHVGTKNVLNVIHILIRGPIVALMVKAHGIFYTNQSKSVLKKN